MSAVFCKTFDTIADSQLLLGMVLSITKYTFTEEEQAETKFMGECQRLVRMCAKSNASQNKLSGISY